MSLLGTGASMPGERNKLVISLGTSGTVLGYSETPVLDLGEGIISAFCDCTGNHMPLICLQNCATVPEEIRQSYGSTNITDTKTILSKDDITALASKEEPGSEGLVMLPYFSTGGERTPCWPHACGVIYGIRNGHLSRPGLMYRLALESVCYGLYRGYCCMLTRGLPVPTEISLVGGGAKSVITIESSKVKRSFTKQVSRGG